MPRDPDRIPLNRRQREPERQLHRTMLSLIASWRKGVICGKLARLWAKYPDMRFFQLMESIVGGRERFYLEDDELLKIIQTLLTNGIGDSKS